MNNKVKRETAEQLIARMNYAQGVVPAGLIIRHVRTGGEYIVRGHCLRVGDLAPMVNYSPLIGPAVVFSRYVPDVRSKFVRVDGVGWGQ